MSGGRYKNSALIAGMETKDGNEMTVLSALALFHVVAS